MAKRRPVGILRFLGTNCDRDVWRAVESVGLTPQWLWFADRFDADAFEAFVVPGGFSYGDYLRCGALAAKAPAMASLADAAKRGRPVLGICNGFQILCEARLLPGALVRNVGRKFIDRWVDLEVRSAKPWLNAPAGARVRLPIAHGEGRYFIDADGLKALWDQGQVWVTYGQNPNGSLDDIAGVSSPDGNVCALMPHPERAMFDWMGGADGRAVFASLT